MSGTGWGQGPLWVNGLRPVSCPKAVRSVFIWPAVYFHGFSGVTLLFPLGFCPLPCDSVPLMGLGGLSVMLGGTCPTLDSVTTWLAWLSWQVGPGPISLGGARKSGDRRGSLRHRWRGHTWYFPWFSAFTFSRSNNRDHACPLTFWGIPL